MVDLTKHSNKPNVPATKPPPKYDKQTKAFFITINNPIEHGFSHEQIINIMHTKFKDELQNEIPVCNARIPFCK